MKRIVSTLFFLLLFAGSAFAASIPMDYDIWYRVHFGLGEGKNAVTINEFNEFLDNVISPSLPMGFTLTQSRGQWSKEGKTVRETTFVLDIQVKDTEENEKLIRDVADKFINKFKGSGNVYIMKIDIESADIVYLK